MNNSTPPAVPSGPPTRSIEESETTVKEEEEEEEDASLKPPPPKKQMVLLRCDLCNLEFTSQIPLDMHLNGAKHAKKLKSENILKSLQQQGPGEKGQEASNLLRCEICNVVANSSQQLQMHIEGNKHKIQCRKLRVDPTQYTKVPEVKKENQENGGGGGDAPSVTSDDALQPPRAKSGKFFCETCQVSLNSQIQLDQHMGSKKHQAQLEGRKLPTKKPWWIFKKKNQRAPPNSNTESTEETTDNTDSEKVEVAPEQQSPAEDHGNNEDFSFAHQESAQ